MKIHRDHIFRSAALAIAIASAAPALFAEEHAIVVGNHHFIYYRDHDIYFSPESRTYYWMRNGHWESGPVLPPEDQPYIASGGVGIDLDTDVPYTRNEYVVSHYKNVAPTTQTTTTERTVAPDGSTTTTTTTTTKHRYVYYGDHDIYFAPDTRTYYWQSNGKWMSGVALPPEDRAYVRRGGVDIELDTDLPYTRHDYVIAHYKHQHVRDEHEHEHEHDEDDDD